MNASDIKNGLNQLIAWIGAVLFFVGMVVFSGIYSFFIVFFAFWVPFRPRYQMIMLWSHFMMCWSRWICGVRCRVIGAENIPKDRAVILLSNHESAWETFALLALFPVQCPVLKKSLLNIPVFGLAIRMLKPIALNRDEPDRALEVLVQEGRDRLDRGYWVTLFPQGTRVAPGTEGKFSLGGAALAAETGYPILPVAHNAGDFWPRRSFLKRRGTITLVIGSLIETKGLSARQIHRLSKNWILETRRGLSNTPSTASTTT